MKATGSHRNVSAGIRNPQSAIRNFSRAFTLIELLVVISILGLMAGLAVPALKNLGKANIVVSASRQMLDGVARARQLAISQRTTVYMVFVPANFWNNNNLTPAQLALPATTNLLNKQLTGYNFLTLRSVGDQPGRGTAHYLGAQWEALPEGTFIATNKFNLNLNSVSPYYYPITDFAASPNVTYPIYCFHYTNNIPFPGETNNNVTLPYIAFNYLGQLTADGASLAPVDEYIPIAQGSILYAHDVNKALVIASPDVSENPPGNSINSMFNIIHIDRLTGRAVVEQQKVQ